VMRERQRWEEATGNPRPSLIRYVAQHQSVPTKLGKKRAHTQARATRHKYYRPVVQGKDWELKRAAAHAWYSSRGVQGKTGQTGERKRARARARKRGKKAAIMRKEGRKREREAGEGEERGREKHGRKKDRRRRKGEGEKRKQEADGGRRKNEINKEREREQASPTARARTRPAVRENVPECQRLANLDKVQGERGSERITVEQEASRRLEL